MSKPNIHLICNAHLDPVWQWQWEEGCSEALSTFRNAVDLLKEYEDLVFNHNEAVLYQWILQHDPDLFKEIQDMVKKGRWSVGGGWYLQPDVNIPCTESIIRCITEGRRFFKQHFNVRPQVAYNFDSFGHGAGLPQILRKAEYGMYIFMRPDPNDLELPSDFCRWQGSDGSEIYFLRISIGLYHTEEDNIEERLREAVEMALDLDRDVPVFWGIGNHGGGATRDDIKRIRRFCGQENRVQFIHSTTDYLFEALKHYGDKAPLVRGDLQNIFPGCYTTLSRLKRRANRSMHLLRQTEHLRTLTWWTLKQPYPQDLMDNLWNDHLFNDFHDILPGTCIEPAEQDALDLYGKIEQTARRLRLEAASYMNRGHKERAYLPITILNCSNGLEEVPVEVEFMISHRPKWEGQWRVHLRDEDSQPIAIQEEHPEALLPFHQWRRKIVFMATMPESGYKRYFAEAHEGAIEQKPAPPALNIATDTQGFVEQIRDESGFNYLNGPLIQPLVIDDPCDSWGTGCRSYRKISDAFEPDSKSNTVLYTGPIRTVYESVMRCQHSQIRLHTIVYNQWRVLEFRLRVNWNEKQKRLKLPFPLALSTEEVLCEVPGGVTTYQADGLEHVHSRWLMLAEGHHAVGVVHNGTHGFDFKDGELRLSALRSPAFCHERGFKLAPYPERKFSDQGVHEVRVLITVGKPETLRQKLPALATWLATPPAIYTYLPVGSVTPPVDSKLNAGQSFIEIHPPDIKLLAMKPSRDGNALSMRLQEQSGIDTKATIRLLYPSMTISCPFRAMEIVTLRIERNGRWRKVNLIDEESEDVL